MISTTCRTCYALTLSDDERARFFARPPSTSVYYCPEHQKIVDEMNAMMAVGDFIKQAVMRGSKQPTNEHDQERALNIWENEGGR